MINKVRFPKGPNEVVIYKTNATGSYLRYAYTYSDGLTTRKCEMNTTWVCGNRNLTKTNNHQEISKDASDIFYIGERLGTEDLGAEIQLFPLPSEELHATLQRDPCVTCVSLSRKCQRIQKGYRKCENHCTTFPIENENIKEIEIRGSKAFLPRSKIEEKIRPPYYGIGDSVKIRSVCDSGTSSNMTCLGNNKWNITGRCTGKL